VSTFYLLPPRPIMGERFAAYLGTLFPGVDWSTRTWPELADLLGTTLARHADVFVVYREELPQGESPAQALRDGFGAETGDEVVEVRPGAKPGELTARRWLLER
jgi:hypothetical protein